MTWSRWESLAPDVRYGIRRLVRSPGLMLAAGLSLALGIGSTTAAFSVLHAVLLRDLPVRDPAALAVVGGRNTGFNYSMSYPAYQYLRDHAPTLDGLIAFRAQPLVVSAGGDAERVSGMLVSGNYFDVLGVPMALGSAIRTDDDRLAQGGPRGLVAVVSHDYWRGRLGARNDVVGRAIAIEGHAAMIVGVAPAGFHGTRVGSLPDIFVPITFSDTVFRSGAWLSNPRNNWLRIIARLRPGVSREQAQAQLTLQLRRFITDVILPLAQTDVWRQRARASAIVLEPGASGLLEMGPTIRPTLYSLMALVGLVLLVACLNVAGLMSARVERSRRETAIARALGATAGRVWRQQLIDAGLVSLIGVGAGWVLVIWLRGLLLGLVPQNQQLDVSTDRVVFGLSLAIGLATALLPAAITARQRTRVDVVGALKGDDADVRLGLRKAVIVGQLALSIMVLLAAGLFVRTIVNLRAVDPGFERTRVLVASIASSERDPDVRRAFFTRLLAEVRAMPGVEAAATANDEPLGVNTGWNIRVARQPSGEPVAASASIAVVSPEYFRTMGIAVVRGRDLEPRDEADARRPVVVNENFVRRYFDAGDPIGRRFQGNGEMTFEIVGVVKDSASIGLRDLDQHMVYLAGGGGALHVRTAGAPATLVPAIEAAVRRLDAGAPMFNVRTIDQYLDRALVRETTFARLSSAFALFAVALAAIGLYGVMASAVSRRRRELGIRLALGAEPRSIVRLIVGEAGRLIVAGVAVGAPLALVVSRVFSSALFGVGAADAATATLAIAAVAAVSVAAAWAPARRASRVDPLVALRSE